MSYLKPGKYTIEMLSDELGLSYNSTLNKLTILKKKGLVMVSGGGKQKRIYTVYNKPQKTTNGFYDIVNKYASEKLNPDYAHIVDGKYTVEDAIIEGLEKKEHRVKDAIIHLFRHIKSWKKLFDLAKKEDVVNELYDLYDYARKKTKTKTMPKRYLNDKH